ncbi:MAG TPA: Vms1/Ankzf1 family peptidyl-tRNA hydrolase [Actinomycetota bacterium]|nr:Vms1/Ankzf1 family peptidyl-tRNA hydrolase [Actinomycetota bacterium]
MADNQPLVGRPVRGLIRRLAETEPVGARVLSVYFSLDPGHFGNASQRSTQIRSLNAEAETLIQDSSLEHDEKVALQRDVERAREYLESGRDVDNTGALALFLCDPIDLFMVLQLPEPAGPSIAATDRPVLEPLARYIAQPDWCVALVNRQNGRIIRGWKDDLVELENVEDYVHQAHSQGGWSQRGYELGIEKEVDDHYGNVVGRLFEMHRREPFDHLVIACPEEQYGEIERAMHDSVRRVLRGRFSADVEHTTVDDIREAAAPLIEEIEAKLERELLDELEQELGKGRNAAATPADVRRALEERRVGTILLDEQIDGSGDMIEGALRQSADVVVIRHHDDLQKYERVAALLRY